MSRRPVVLLVDGDVLVYRSSFAVERNTDWGDGLHTWHADLDEAKASVHGMITSFSNHLNADKIVMALTCSDTPNFRKAFYPEYKMNRANTRKPLLWREMREYLIEKFDTRIRPNLEADDIIGILATMPNAGQDRIIVSIDKDFKAVPGRLFNMLTKKMSLISQAEADRNFMRQVLIGDSTDNYPGCPGVGPKTAEKILQGKTTLEDMWKAVVQAYKNRGKTTADALVQARCARILRISDYDSKNRQPILWTPTVVEEDTDGGNEGVLDGGDTQS